MTLWDDGVMTKIIQGTLFLETRIGENSVVHASNGRGEYTQTKRRLKQCRKKRTLSPPVSGRCWKKSKKTEVKSPHSNSRMQPFLTTSVQARGRNKIAT